GIDTDDELGYQLVVVGEGAGASDSSGLEVGAVDSADAGATVASPGESSAAAASSVEYDPEGEFTVQVAVYPDARRAAERVLELDDLGYPAYAIAGIEGVGVRVRIGYFKTRSNAHRFGHIFSQDTGSEFWVDRRVNEMY
ncbi:MAG TPA: SPOR domain-containing protein, partial [Candidatus Latescibacteria bacterium]|nr:SPOR domain-containing protein [Candidatus Latescibacterota bacterium]